MSVLHNRIATAGQPAATYQHPAGTPATVMEMPMSEHAYDGNTALYGSLTPLITADGAVVAGYSPAHAAGVYADVHPAGRP